MVKREANQEGHKYLGILEREDVCQYELKKMVKRQHFKRVRAVLKSSLNSGNVISALNSRAPAIVRYGSGIINRN